MSKSRYTLDLGLGSRGLILDLVKKAGFTLVGSTTYAACQWGLLIVLAHLGGPSVVGQYSFALAVTAPVMLLASLGLEQSLLTDSRRAFGTASYFRLRIVTVGTTTIGLILGALWLAEPDTAAVLAAVTVAKAMEAMSTLRLSLFQRRERMGLAARSSVLRGLGGLLAFGTAFAITDSLAAGVGAMTVIFFLVWSLHDVPLSSRGEPSSATSASECRHLAWTVLPLGLALAVISLNLNIPRLAIERTQGEAALGQFAAMVYLTLPLGMVINAIGVAMSPRLSRAIAAGRRREFWHIVSGLALFCAAAGTAVMAGAWAVGQPVMTWVYGPAFHTSADILVWVMAAAVLSYIASPFGFGMTAARLFRPQLPLFAATTTVCLVASVLLVPRFGLLGAAWAMILLNGFQAIGSLHVLRRGLSAGKGSPV